jgi:sugar diacid utilization regulator
MWDHLIETVAPNPRVRIELLRRVPVTFTTLSHVTTLVTEAYVIAREHLLQSRGEVLDEFLRLLVTADVPLPTLDARAREFGLDLAVPRVAVFFRRGVPVAGESAAEREAVARLAAVCAASSNAIVGRVQRDVLALLSTNGHLGVLAEVDGDVADHRWSVGVGSSAADAAGLRRSALEARRAIELGTLLRRPPPTYRYADIVVHDLVDAGSPRALSFAHQALGTLAISGTHGRYRETLQALCAQGFRVKPAAAALGIHPHTLSYRVKQMRDRHGLDIDDPHTRLRVELALLILDT